MKLCDIRIAVISDRAVLPEAIEDRLNSQSEMTVEIASSRSGVALQQISNSDIDVAILDADRSSGQAFEFASQIGELSKKTKLIFLAGTIAVPLIRQALRLNTCGILAKTESTAAIVDAVRGAVGGRTSFSAEVQRWLKYDDRRRRFDVADHEADSQLTNQQLVVLRHLASGDCAKEVARKLELSRKSVESHSYRIMKKLGIHDRVQLCRYAIRHGLIEP
ncbi:MAG: response regulator transcription factor [Planctomycetaceae bacterium]|jgi:DNA-binding NarL/FixJ family response regulator|nr:response regulator transcription factor [Planctomycetaceae bacterium]MBT6153488.1 response regulator transcription factor [Planctomycetaceae bacterium]MBT6484017.1 response regulator transcription factor [Planctomycetaceae bacterium]MBT6495486.1 response regulator transcription factor [Planctomycetaceae bacterium]